MRILLVEDDLMIGESLKKALKQSGYNVDWTVDPEQAELSIATHTYDLLLLDLGLPRESGIELLKRQRQKKNSLPVIIITARDSVEDKVIGLDCGADDYLVKPFDIDELEARIRALLRRRDGRVESLLSIGEISLNPVTHEIIVEGKAIFLSAREYALMHTLMERPGVICSVPQLEDQLYGWNEEVESNAIEVHIYQLRKKLGKNIIQNVRGVGYRLGSI
jgi:two-component system response regulator QseB